MIAWWFHGDFMVWKVRPTISNYSCQACSEWSIVLQRALERSHRDTTWFYTMKSRWTYWFMVCWWCVNSLLNIIYRFIQMKNIILITTCLAKFKMADQWSILLLGWLNIINGWKTQRPSAFFSIGHDEEIPGTCAVLSQRISKHPNASEYGMKRDLQLIIVTILNWFLL